MSTDVSGVGRMAGVLSLPEPSRPDPCPGLGDAALTPCLLVFPSFGHKPLSSSFNTEHIP